MSKKLFGLFFILGVFSLPIFAFGQSAGSCPFDLADLTGFVLNSGQSMTGYEFNIAQNSTDTSCKDVQQITISCNSGILSPSDYSIYYSTCFGNCVFPQPLENPRTKQLVVGLGHSGFIPVYSEPSAEYPKTCNQFSGSLSCNNGNIVGNTSILKYSDCIDSGGLVQGVDLILEAGFPGGATTISQYSTPAVNIVIKNRGDTIVDQSLDAGFLQCYFTVNSQNIVIYNSPLIENFILNPGTKLATTIVLSNLFTQAKGSKTVFCSLKSIGSDNSSNNSRSGTIEVVESSRFDIAMSRAIDSIKDHLDSPETKLGAEGVNDFLINKIMNVLVPLIVVVGILVSLLGFYKLLFSTEDAAMKDGIKYISFGLVGIIVIMSAKFITNVIYSDIFNSGVLGFGDVQGFDIADTIYRQLLFPFLKMASYLALGVLFVILVTRVIGFVFASDDETKKKAGTIIGWNVIGMLVIIGAKQIVEAVYGKQGDVVKAITNLGEIGSGLFKARNIPLFYSVINWALGLASLVVLIMVLVQAFGLLMKPDSADQSKSLKNSLLYIFIGIMVIGVGYVVTNFLIIN